MESALWTRGARAQSIEREFGVRLSIRVTGEYLRRWGFTPQKPIKRACEQRPEAVKHWIDSQYPAIVRRAKDEGGEIHWGDQTARVNTDVRGRSDAPRGRTPVTARPPGDNEPSIHAGCPMTPLPFAHGTPPLQATLRSVPEDFAVDELDALEPDGEGDHAWLRVRKRGANTDWVAKELARFCGVEPVDVGYAGLKDRHALTTQVFTVHLPGKPDPDWASFPHEDVRILDVRRHRRKLKRGALRGNAFTLILRAVQGDRAAAELTLREIALHGVPNYFGDQRFGSGGANVERAEAMFAGKRCDRQTRSMLLSAARAHLFNTVLAERVRQQTWCRSLQGEVWSLAGSRSWFGPEPLTEDLERRISSGDIHPSGPLWGRGALPTRAAAQQLEEQLLAPFATILAGLEAAGLEQDRRALRLLPQDLSWIWLGDDVLSLSFSLPPGTYATVVVRELLG